MKYLKRFNEELNNRTYRRAAKALRAKGHESRAKELEDWIPEKQRRESFKKWEELKEKYSKYGTFKVKIKTPTEEKIIDTYLFLNYPMGMLSDAWINDPYAKESAYFSIEYRLVPTSIEDIEMLSNMKETDFDFYGGCFNGGAFTLNFKVEDYDHDKNQEGIKIVFNEIEVDGSFTGYIDSWVNNAEIIFADRRSAMKFKRILLDILNQKIDYDDMYNSIETELMNQLSLSVDYGFEMKDLINRIEEISINDLFN